MPFQIFSQTRFVASQGPPEHCDINRSLSVNGVEVVQAIGIITMISRIIIVILFHLKVP